MDYEKAYNEALERAKKELKACGSQDCDAARQILRLFPELKESEYAKTKRILYSISNKISFHLRDIFTEEEFQCFNAWSHAWLKEQGILSESEKSRDEIIRKTICESLKYMEAEYDWGALDEDNNVRMSEAYEWLERQKKV